MKTLIGIAFLAAVSTPALAQTVPPAPTVTERTATPAYASMAMSGDNYEIESSKLVLGNAVNPDVRAFADMMITDHGRMQSDMLAAAKAASIGNPGGTRAPEAAMMKELRATPKARMERFYVDQQVIAHERALALHQGYAAQGDNPGMRAVAAAAIPVVQHHLDEIRRIQAAMHGN
ncbi:DUF4142 domain-containing protein [Sphingomonas tabacisoli]|uniref:DUF4142 domain-containing protein n=1 Tax=Sphingomonas tabacisoli TaxID=2249466 RepID=A0ABW4I2I0_9SPHN